MEQQEAKKERRQIPRLDASLWFPHPSEARPDGLLACGGDLSMDRLLLAYTQGIFPWYGLDLPILWFSPPERAIVEPDLFHLPRRLRSWMRQHPFDLRVDTDFAAVIKGCAEAPRRGSSSTWLIPDMQEAYFRLHQAGHAHSVEVYRDNTLVGGVYGISLGAAFFAESMFSLVSNASKVALVFLVQLLQEARFQFIDCQMQNDHLRQFGVHLIPREDYLNRLQHALLQPNCWPAGTFMSPR